MRKNLSCPPFGTIDKAPIIKDITPCLSAPCIPALLPGLLIG